MSNTNVRPSKATALARVQAIIAGTQKHSPNGSLTFGNATYTSASLVQLLESLVAAMLALNLAQAGAKDAMTALHDVKAKIGPVYQAYRRFLLATYGNATQTLADYGLEPPKARAPLTSVAKANATLKLRATRKLRGTTSKKQKAALKGTVVTPVGELPPVPAPAPPKPTT